MNGAADGLQRRVACLFAALAGFRADLAMFVHLGVALALFAAHPAGLGADHQETADNVVVRSRSPSCDRAGQMSAQSRLSRMHWRS